MSVYQARHFRMRLDYTIGPAGPLTETEEKYIHTHLVEQNLHDSGDIVL